MVRGWRRRAGLSQAALAERAGVSAAAVAALEQGQRRQPRPRTLRQLAAALELDPTEEAALLETAAIHAPNTGQTIGSPAWSLPAVSTPLIGRESELRALTDLLLGTPPARLITLTGPGGVGKTRLAVAVATEARSHFADGAVLVELASLRDPRLVRPTIVHALNLREAASDDASEALPDALRSKHLLLVLDNFEQLTGASTFLAALVDACPRLSLLVTSRTALRVRAERRFALEPLGLPDTSETSLAAIADSPAVRLFSDRAVATQQDFALTPETARTVAAICRRLDGLPLAIELAAALVLELPPAALEARLRHRLSLLTDGPPDLPERQQTLRATLDWSYALLPPAEQVLFRQLSVFTAVWTLAAAEAVCRPGSSARPDEVAPLLRSLLDRSLIRRAESVANEAHFEMLETVREYAAELLAASGDETPVRTRLAIYYRELAEAAEIGLRGSDSAAWVGLLASAQDNIRAVLASAVETGDLDTGLRIASAIWQFWWMRGQFQEGQQWLDDLLAVPDRPGSSQSIRAKAFTAAASLAHATGDDSRARERCEQAVAAATAAGDRARLASSLHHLGSLAAQEGDAEQAITCVEASLSHARAVGASDVVAVGLCTLGGAVRQTGDLARASRLLEQSLDLLRALGNWLWEQSVLRHMAEVARDRADWRTAEARHKDALRLCQTLGRGYALGVAKSFEGLAEVAVAHGHAMHAARLLGAAARLRDEISSPVVPSEREFVHRLHAATRASLGGQQFADACTAGAALEPSDAVELALATSTVELAASPPAGQVAVIEGVRSSISVAPTIRDQLISRQRLLEQLDAALMHSLTLVVAPPGAGKTSVLLDWTARVGTRATVAWLGLDRGDDDPVRFWRHVLAALENQQVSLGGRAHDALRGGYYGPELLSESLLADLDELEKHLVLIVDDYHLIQSAPIHSAVRALLANTPRRFHLVLSTRHDPPLPLARRRAAADLVELRAADLRFSEAESGEMLNTVIGHDLAFDQVRAVAARTEGWAAGLQLAALSLRGAPDTDTAIARFSGDDRFVLEQLPPATRQFVMATSILSRLSGALCDAVMHTSGSSEILQELERKSLFVAPIDDRHEWYRYHQLFAEVLRHTLRREAPELEVEVRNQAIDWYQANGLIEDAIEQALSARCWERAADLMGTRVRGLIRDGQEATANRWLAALPNEVLQQHPLLSGLRVVALLQAGEVDSAVAFIAAAEHKLSEPRNRDALGRLASMRALAAVLREDRSALAHAERALELLPSGVSGHRLSALDAIARTHLMLGDTRLAADTLEQLLPLLDVLSAPLATLQVHNTLGLQRLQEGRLRAAGAQFEALLTMAADRPTFHRQQTLIGLAVVAYERDELDDAADLLDRFDEARRELGRTPELPFPWLVRAWIARARGDLAAALDALGRCEAAARRFEHARLQRLARACRARLALDNHDLELALDWASDFDNTAADAEAYAREAELLMRARVWLAQGHARQPLPMLFGALSRAEQTGRTASILAVSAVLATALAQAPEGDEATRRLERALALAEPEGYVRVFVDEGAQLRPLLRALSRQPAIDDYVARLLAALDGGRRAAPAGVNPLTAREREVLELLAQGLSNRAIAGRLVTSEATIKSHVHRLIGKFGVSTRAQVLLRARQQGLVD